ncbi:unnamed protein product [Schistosoma curassoni]|uniref:DUF5641 domain-containing protein n=1 Tax=Schistosoma curassoni TaxID=6186 RepID=A0A183L1F9_9TREM|nr:unnamed protein product [Schistosoma curassoni]
MIELELARLCITQLEKEIELEKLRRQRCGGSDQSEQADIANTRYGLLVNLGSNSDNKDVGVLKGKISTEYNAARISYASTSDYNAPICSSSCLECFSNHFLDQCQKFKDKNVSGRKEFVLRHKLCNEKLEDKFEQLYSTRFKDPLSRTSSMSVEDRIALSESAYGVAESTRPENVSRQVHYPFLLTKSKKVLMDESSGDLVLVNNVGSPRSLWPKAIVEKVSYGSDGQVRTVKLRTANEETVRDVRSLCLLEGAGCLTTTTLDSGRGARFGRSVKCDL